mmetsp:Transcript_39485/g.50970  ORF Transcript_39485/g.50970 Transcript_39485/m.50970 type:complete len:98 (+) Transcript_39485:105-398(+)
MSRASILIDGPNDIKKFKGHELFLKLKSSKIYDAKDQIVTSINHDGMNFAKRLFHELLCDVVDIMMSRRVNIFDMYFSLYVTLTGLESSFKFIPVNV